VAYQHGIYITEKPTELLPPVQVDSAIPFVVGTAPVYLSDAFRTATPSEKRRFIGVPLLINNASEAAALLGYRSGLPQEMLAKFSLLEFLEVYLELYRMSPCILVNVFDPDASTSTGKFDTKTVSGKKFEFNRILLDDKYLWAVSLTIPGGGEVIEGIDYLVDYDRGTITRVVFADTSKQKITEDTPVEISYKLIKKDATLATEEDIIGDSTKNTGLTAIEEVYPRFRVIPSLVLAPGYAQKVRVSTAMLAASSSINGHFRAVPIVDLPEGTEFTDLATAKKAANLSDSYLICWPKTVLGGREHWMSSHAAGLIASVDATSGGIPYRSPSNVQMQIAGVRAGAKEIWLDTQRAAYVNSLGMVTALNFTGGWKLWGSRLGCYPAVTDPKDSFLPIRRMMSWIKSSLVLLFWSELDYPISKRSIATVLNSANLFLTNLRGRQAILDGRVEFLDSENPTTSVMDGHLCFHLWVTPPSPAESIEFVIEYDPSAIKTLFSS
jgi:uncharacterized protein